MMTKRKVADLPVPSKRKNGFYWAKCKYDGYGDSGDCSHNEENV